MLRRFLFLSFMLTCSYNAKSQPYAPLHTETTFNTGIDVGKPIGSITGNATVNLCGAAVYSIPVPCAPGTSGMTPSISLEYSSQHGDGIMGRGWSVNGISAISRTGDDNFHEADNSVVTYSNYDHFILQGQRLVPHTGNNGDHGTTYVSEEENYSLTTSYGNIGGGPESFKVVTKDGTIMEYGGSSNSRMMNDDNSVVMEWYLNKIRDINGNYIEFVYTNTDGNFRIAEINYTGNDVTGMTPYSRIRFYYEERSDKNIIYHRGGTRNSSYLLTGISSKDENYIYTEFRLTYGRNAEASYLKSIAQLQGSGSSSINETRFLYGENGRESEETETDLSIPYAASSPTSVNYDIISGDFDGDGKSEILKASFDYTGGSYRWDRNYLGFELFTQNASGSYTVIPGSSVTFPSPSSNSKYLIGYQKNTDKKGNHFLQADFNGDGKDDLLFMNLGSGNTYNGVTIYYSKMGKVSSGFTAVDYAPDAIAGGHKLANKNSIFIGDFDGDGVSEFAYLTQNTNPSSGIVSYNFYVSFPRYGLFNQRVKASWTPGATASAREAAWMNEQPASTLDFDGDGQTDILTFLPATSSSAHFAWIGTIIKISGTYVFKQLYGGGYPLQNYHEVLGIGDFNGDGKSDLVVAQKPNYINTAIAYSTGIDFKEIPFVMNPQFNKKCVVAGSGGKSVSDIADFLYVGDYDGDGKSDIWHARKYCTNEAEYFNKADFVFYNFKGHTEKTNLIDKHLYTVPYAISEVIAPVLSDVNGDGQSEISLKAFDKDKMRQFFFKKNDQSRFLSKIRNGMGHVTSFNYKPLSQSDGTFYIKDPSPAYPYNYSSSPIYVVTEASQPNGIGGENRSKYIYSNLLMHRAAKGILGFKIIQAIDFSLNVRVETQYGLDETYIRPYIRRRISYQHAPSLKISETQYNYSFSGAGGPSYRFKCELKSTSEEDPLMQLITTTSNTFDSYGNVVASESELNKTTAIGSLPLSRSSTKTTFVTAGVSAIPHLPVAVIQTVTRGSLTPFTQKDSFRYNSNGALVCHKAFDGSAGLFSKDSCEYDAYGNIIKKVKMGAYPAKTIIQQFEFDADYHRFCIKETDPLGGSSQTQWHSFWGKPTRIIAANGLETNFNYDQFGVLISKRVYTAPGIFYTVNYSRGFGGTGNEVYYTSESHPTAPDSKTYYDILGRVLRNEREGFSGWKKSVQTFDSRGNVHTSTNEYYDTEIPRVTTRTYDALNRPASVTDVSGTTTFNYAMGDGFMSTTINYADGRVKTSITDGTGKTIKVSDNITGTVHFEYDSRGNEISSGIGTTGASYATLIRKEYDAWGNLKKMIDPDAGTITYNYNVYGQLMSQKDPNGKTTNFEYDFLGRPIIKNISGYSTTFYEYYGADKDYRLKKAVSGHGGVSITDEFDYTAGSGLTRYTRTTPIGIFEKSYTYDNYGRLLVSGYLNSGFKTLNYYDVNGYLKKITTYLSGGLKEKTLFEATSANGDDQLTAFKRVDGIISEYKYTNGFPTSINAFGVQSVSMHYNYANGNLTDRSDNISNTSESFRYDGAERLISSAAAITPGGSMPAGSHPPIDVSYDTRFYGSFGQIVSKTDAGNFKYGGAIRNAVTSISDPNGLVSHETQNISYTGFNKVEKITETITSIPYEESFYYGPDEQRAYSEQKQAGVVSRQRIYFDEFEAQRISGKMQMLHYIYSSDGNICGIVVADGVSGRFDYYGAYTDHLGSIVAVTDETGHVLHRQAFDPWGRERNPDTWDYTASAYKKPDWLFRGYTGHEMLPEYGLINMNGRLYDPLNGRMLRPDNYVQDPGNTQSYNRYSYCWNNPLKYTDPSGDIIYLMPNYSMGNDGKANIGLTVGIGIPNTPLNVNLTVGHDFSSGNTYASVGVGSGGFSANAGWGTKSGFFANVGWGPGGYNGFSTNATGIGIGVSEHGGMYASIGPFGINSQGVGFGVSFSYAQALVYDYSIDVEGGGEDDGIYTTKEFIIYGKSVLTQSRNAPSPVSINTSLEVNYKTRRRFNIDNALDWLNNNALNHSKGKCAYYVRLALEAGGINTYGHPVAAWQYGAFLPKLGFSIVNTNLYKRGDIAVIKGPPGGAFDPKTGIPYGHIQMYNGRQWISDFKQNQPFWPGVNYRRCNPSFQIFRWTTF